MKINRKDLLKALQSVNPGVATKATVEQSSTFVFDDGRVYTYNDEISVSAPVDLDLTGSVSAKELLALVNKLSGTEITLTLKDNDLRVSCGKSNAGLRFDPEIRLPLDELGSPKDWTDLPAKFTEAVKFCLFSAGRDQNQYLLTNIHVHDGFVESSDGYRATQYDIKEGFQDDPILIPATSARPLVNYAPTEYARTDGWLHFRNEGDVVFSCRWPEGEEYPPLDDFINKKGEKIQLPEGLDKIMDRGVTLSDGERLTLILEDGGNLILATENEVGWYEEETEINYKGKPMEFDIYPEFLSTILKIKADAFLAPNLMRFETDDFIHVVALLAPKKRK